MNSQNLIDRLKGRKIHECLEREREANALLSKQLAAANTEIEWLKSDALYYLANERALLEKLTASQDVNQKLREALEHFALIDLGRDTLPATFGMDVLGARKALSLPNDTTALNEVIQRTAEKVKEMCAAEVEKVVFGHFECGGSIRSLDVSKVLEEE